MSIQDMIAEWGAFREDEDEEIEEDDLEGAE